MASTGTFSYATILRPNSGEFMYDLDRIIGLRRRIPFSFGNIENAAYNYLITTDLHAEGDIVQNNVSTLRTSGSFVILDDQRIVKIVNKTRALPLWVWGCFYLAWALWWVYTFCLVPFDDIAKILLYTSPELVRVFLKRTVF